MAVSTADEFFAVIEKSGLLTPPQLAHARNTADRTDNAQATAWRLVSQELISRWQAAQLLAGRSAFHLGKYRLIEPLGRGGMGSVFLGRHVTMNRRVALKVLSRQAAADPKSLERLLAEARAVASLDHPNIVQAYSVDNDGDHYYFVMEYVEGIDLQRLVQTEGPLEDERAVDYVRQAADGLDHAHQRNLVHGDVKPSNLLVNLHGVIKMLDLGLARFTGDEELGTGGSEQAILGSVDYLAPEQAIESPARDHRVDIYSLGCTLYFLLTGHPPFPQGTLPERILKHQTQEPPDLRAEQPEAPAELAAVCQKMMAKNPEDRYPSAAEVSRVLGELQSAMPPRPRPVAVPMVKLLDELAEDEARLPTAAAKPKAKSRRHIGLIVLILLMLVELLALLIVTLGHAETLRNERAPATTKAVSVPQASP